MQETPRACVDRILTADRQWQATEAALAERDGNSIDSGRLGDAIAASLAQAGLEEFAGGDRVKREALVSFSGKRWQNGRTIRFHFLDGPEWARDKAFALMRRWLDVANLRFERTRDRKASDVRVSFAWDTGSWSYLGPDAMAIPDDEPTMNYGWLLGSPDDFEEWRRVCLHEGGHMFGFGHEQAHPEGDIDWNKEAVYAHYSGPPNNWSRAEVDAQVFRKYSGKPLTNFSRYDRRSIMHYPIPRGFVLDPKDVVGWNSERSKSDRRTAALWYPKPGMEAAITAALDAMAREAEAVLAREGA